MKELKLIRTTHNGEKCYKDENKLFMVVKSYNGKYWRLLKAKQFNDKIINELKAWGYEEINPNWKIKTLSECVSQAYEELRWGVWWDDYQIELKNQYID